MQKYQHVKVTPFMGVTLGSNKKNFFWMGAKKSLRPDFFTRVSFKNFNYGKSYNYIFVEKLPMYPRFTVLTVKHLAVKLRT